MKEMVLTLKNENQDFEFYPTTEVMIKVIHDHIKKDLGHETYSLLDIGAGDGRVLATLERLAERKLEKYAIEKSTTLIRSLPADIGILGTDFHRQTLIDKETEVIFCNPPYSEFEEWTQRIMLEGNAQAVYMIIPSRWKENKRILDAIQKRKARYKVLKSTDFLDAERQARAKVDIIYFDLSGYDDERSRKGNGKACIDPFDLWFEENFKIHIPKEEESECQKEEAAQKRIGELVRGKNHIDTLVELYRCDMDRLGDNYKALKTLDPELLKELGANLDALRSGLRKKIGGLKKLYWKELFDRLSSITNRLTTETRGKMLSKMSERVNVDFLHENIYAIVIWILKNANQYIDSQLLDLYRKMTERENVINYKSNRHMTEDTWRYLSWDKKEVSHYALDYRLVLRSYEAIGDRHGGGYCLHYRASEYLGDIFTVANNLGFNAHWASREWTPGGAQEFHYRDGGEAKTFARFKVYRNGNIHVQFAQKFIQALNVEAGRLNGWIKSPKDASEEMGIPEDEAEKFFRKNLQLGASAVPMLMAGEDTEMPRWSIPAP